MLRRFKQIRSSEWALPSRNALIAFFSGCAIFFLLLVMDRDGFIPILDHANLAFHEAGHVFFGIFGHTANLYGGTLGQFVFPLVVIIAFWLRRKPIEVAVGWMWFFENLRYVATYVADARARVLPMAGTGPKIHDWWAILRRWDALEHDTTIAAVFNGLAWAGMLLPVAWIVWRILVRKKKQPMVPRRSSQ